MVLTPKGYQKRLVDKQIDDYLESFGAVSIEGPKWCGKTWAARNHSNSEFQLNRANISLLDIDTGYAFRGEYPRLIDEWQDYAGLWDETRFNVDNSNENGRFILCGSSAVDECKKKHSGSGRIGTIRMHTMSLFESGDSDGFVSLEKLFDGDFRNSEIKEVPLEQLIHLAYRGGWPSLVVNNGNPGIVLKDYIDKLCKVDTKKIDGKTRNPHKLLMMLKSLARNESTVVSDAALRRDMREYDQEEISESTLDDYKGVFEKLNILWYQNAYSSRVRSSSRIGKSPKKHLADPSLAMSLLAMNESRALGDLETFGFIFESLCERDLKIYSDYNGYELFHYRDDSGREIDAIVERPDGVWGAFEIKLGINQVDAAAESLLKIADYFEVRPKFLCVLCGNAPAAYRRPDGVYVVPICRLGP